MLHYSQYSFLEKRRTSGLNQLKKIKMKNPIQDMYVYIAFSNIAKYKMFSLLLTTINIGYSFHLRNQEQGL